jgi:transcription elongation factor GreA
MPEQRVPMTPNGQRQMQEKLKQLRSVERPKSIKAIEEARGHGDLSENAEYDAAKERQQQLSAQIEMLEHKLSLAQVIDPTTLNLTRVAFGATVELVNTETDEKVCYKIVGVDEADISNGKISIESPIARALIGKEEGDEVTVSTPRGSMVYEVVNVKYV